MRITTDDLYRMIGELYVANHILTVRVQKLTPRPDQESENSIPDLGRSKGMAT